MNESKHTLFPFLDDEKPSRPQRAVVWVLSGVAQIFSEMTVLLMTVYVLLSLTSLGFLIDQRSNAAMWEMLRCFLLMALYRFDYMRPLDLLAFPIEVFVLISVVYWALQSFIQQTNKVKKQN